MANEYIYAKDMGRAVDLATTVKKPSGMFFNIGNGVVTSFAELQTLVRKVHPTIKIEVKPGEAPQSKAQPLDISAAKRELGWSPEYSLAAALADYAADLAKIGPDAKTRLRA